MFGSVGVANHPLSPLRDSPGASKRPHPPYILTAPRRLPSEYCTAAAKSGCWLTANDMQLPGCPSKAAAWHHCLSTAHLGPHVLRESMSQEGHFTEAHRKGMLSSPAAGGREGMVRCIYASLEAWHVSRALWPLSVLLRRCWFGFMLGGGVGGAGHLGLTHTETQGGRWWTA